MAPAAVYMSHYWQLRIDEDFLCSIVMVFSLDIYISLVLAEAVQKYRDSAQFSTLLQILDPWL